MPNPASVVVPKCSKSVLRACSAWKSHDGRVVIAPTGWPRRMRTQGASRLSSEIRISAGLSRAISSTSSVRETPGQREPAGRELDPGQAELAADLDDGRQVVGRLGVEQLVVGQRARRDDPDDLALDQPLGELRVLDLLADRRPLARPGRAWPGTTPAPGGGTPPSARRRPLVLVAGRQRQAEQGRGALGVLAEHLVEVAHAEQQQGVGIAGLQLAILLHHRGQGRVIHEVREPEAAGRSRSRRPVGIGWRSRRSGAAGQEGAHLGVGAGSAPVTRSARLEADRANPSRRAGRDPAADQNLSRAACSSA